MEELTDALSPELKSWLSLIWVNLHTEMMNEIIWLVQFPYCQYNKSLNKGNYLAQGIVVTHVHP